MNRPSTADRAALLAAAAAEFAPWLGLVTSENLLAHVAAELGHAAILDGFQTHGGHFARAVAPRVILHVISGNTPHAGLQSLLRGLLLGAHNLCKLPAGGLPEVTAFARALPPELAANVELSEGWREDWLERADAVIVFGSDATLAVLRRRVRADQIWSPHGHKVSLGLILDDPLMGSLVEAARAVSLFDQRGCLSPHLYYVREEAGLTARAYAAGLADEMARYSASDPPLPRTSAESAQIQQLRADWQFRAANDPERYAVSQSEGSTGWTVLFDGAEPGFTASPLQRTVFVKPLPADLRAALAGVRPHLSAIALWPATREWADWAANLDLGASRLCSLAAMQLPPLTWHQDGAASLASLVRWVDFDGQQ